MDIPNLVGFQLEDAKKLLSACYPDMKIHVVVYQSKFSNRNQDDTSAWRVVRQNQDITNQSIELVVSLFHEYPKDFRKSSDRCFF